jgi:hypothetical protein
MEGIDDLPGFFRSRIRDILLNDWDPNNAAKFEWSRGEYDVYIDPLLDLIQNGASEDAIVEWLHDRERESMCFPGLGTQRLLPVARKLMALNRGEA